MFSNLKINISFWWYFHQSSLKFLMSEENTDNPKCFFLLCISIPNFFFRSTRYSYIKKIATKHPDLPKSALQFIIKEIFLTISISSLLSFLSS
jgi:hypothetical protein